MMSLKLKLICLFVLTCGLELGDGKTVRDVTCGSVLKLINTSFHVRLHSHDVKYGSGSGQQSVTGVDLKEDVNSHWMVKGAPGRDCKRGEPIPCGGKIRLEHPPTEKNLHSHHFSSPLSHHQEISAYGKEGEGDSGDIWEVVCRGNSWKRDETIQLLHKDTNAYLGVSGNTFGRPIHGQYEIVGVEHADASTHWQAQEGIFIHPTEQYRRPEHNEL